jgi:antitoxin PrlF
MNEIVPKTKIAERLLTRAAGATMREIIAETGGPQYNELKRLAARGYAIRKAKEGNETRYFALPPVNPAFEATITSKGQVTIPQEIRQQLRLRRGHKLRFTIENGDRAVMTPVSKRLSELAGILPKPKRPVSLEEMDEGIRRAAVVRYRRAAGRKR